MVEYASNFFITITALPKSCRNFGYFVIVGFPGASFCLGKLGVSEQAMRREVLGQSFAAETSTYLLESHDSAYKDEKKNYLIRLRCERPPQVELCGVLDPQANLEGDCIRDVHVLHRIKGNRRRGPLACGQHLGHIPKVRLEVEKPGKDGRLGI